MEFIEFLESGYNIEWLSLNWMTKNWNSGGEFIAEIFERESKSLHYE